ncbi:MAG: SDR family oxidoreductase [Bacteroidota bacterium]
MDLGLTHKTALITGSTAGIGFATAKTLAQEGASVYLHGRSETGVQAAISKLKAALPQADIHGIAADASQAADLQRLTEQLPEIDILVNNVGIYTSQPFFETADEDWQRQFEVNVMSGVRLSRHYLPKMLKANWGRILFISSECATLVPADLIAYSMTKAALLAVSRGLAQLTGGSEVTVNTIIPGSTFTEGAEQFLKGVAKQEGKSVAEVETAFFQEVRTSSLLQRFAKVEEVAHTIAYFASPLSSATNGASIKVDGGSMGGL